MMDMSMFRFILTFSRMNFRSLNMPLIRQNLRYEYRTLEGRTIEELAKLRNMGFEYFSVSQETYNVSQYLKMDQGGPNVDHAEVSRRPSGAWQHVIRWVKVPLSLGLGGSYPNLGVMSQGLVF